MPASRVLDVDARSLAGLNGMLERLAVRAAVVTEQVAPLIIDDWHRLQQERFTREGPGWAELTDATQADRARRGYEPDHPILQREQRLADSLTGTTGDSVTDVSVDEVTVATRVPYARYHQTGAALTQWGGHPIHATLPQRRLVPEKWELERRWLPLVQLVLILGR